MSLFHLLKSRLRFGIVFLLLAAFFLACTGSVHAQPGWRPRPPHGPPHHHPGPPPPPPPHHHRGPSDFEKAMHIVGAVGAVAAAANGYSPYVYHRQPRPVVVVPNRQTIVVEKQVPVIVEKSVFVERPVPVIEKQPKDYYSPKLGATFIIQNMKIPGYAFTAARLTSNPLDGSPLNEVNLRKGDVITRLDNEPVESLSVLESHEKNTVIRYIKTGTTKVQLGRIYIPTDDDFHSDEEDTYYAP